MHIKISGTGYPLVLFHGWGFDQSIWDALTREIGERFTIYAVDLPGFGRSPLMNWSTFQSGLLKRLPAQFALAGWSLGGMYATRLALEAGTRVSHLVNVASSPRFIKDDNWPGVEHRVLDSFFTELVHDPVTVRSQFVALQAQHQPPQTDACYLPGIDGLKSGLDVLANWDLREALHNLAMPACFMFGRLDSITPRATLARMKTLYPQFDYVLFHKSAHMPFMTHQQDFICELERFIKMTEAR